MEATLILFLNKVFLAMVTHAHLSFVCVCMHAHIQTHSRMLMAPVLGSLSGNVAELMGREEEASLSRGTVNTWTAGVSDLTFL